MCQKHFYGQVEKMWRLGYLEENKKEKKKDFVKKNTVHK